MKDSTPASELTHLVNQLIAAFRSSKIVGGISHDLLGLSETSGSSGGLTQSSKAISPSAATIKLPGIVHTGAALKAILPVLPVHKPKVTSSPASTSVSTIFNQVKSAISSPSGALSGGLGGVFNAITGTRPATSSSSVGGFFSHILQGGLGVLPLISGIVGLFKGHSAPPPPLIRYLLPKSVQLDVGLSHSQQIGSVDYSQNNQPRATSAIGQTQAAVTVPFEASLLDYSDQIAQAVKQALLYSHSLNDVIADL